MTDFDDAREKWMQDPGFVKAYEALGEEFSLASAMIAARAHAGMTRLRGWKHRNPASPSRRAAPSALP